MKIHIGIAGPVSTEIVARFIDGGVSSLPIGYPGAPLLGTLIGELLARGHRVSVYTTSADLPLNIKNPVVATGERFKIYYCPMREKSVRMNGWHLGRIIDFFRLERRFLVNAIHSDNPDIVSAHWAYEFALAAIASGKPHVVTCHDSPRKVLKYMPNVYRLGRYFMAIWAMRWASKLTTVSPYMQDQLLHLVRQEIALIPNPLPSGIANRAVNLTRKLSNTHPVVIMVANGWGRLKNADVGLFAFAKLRAKICGAQLRVFGTDFGEGQIAQQWAHMHGLTAGVEFVGKLPYEDLLDEMSKGDICLHTSLEESFGMVVAEAMALGLPVVGGNKSGAVPWIVGAGGFLVDITNPDEIAFAMEEILSCESKWLELRVKAQESSRARFSTSVVVDAYEDIFRQQIQCNLYK